MNLNTGRKTLRVFLYAFAAAGVAAIVYAAVSVFNGAVTTTVYAQQDLYLDRRLSQIEQRFTFIESRISRLEQGQSRFPEITTPGTTSGANETDIRLLRSQIETLNLRLAEVECGVAKLDERTLSSAGRLARKKSLIGENDRCRANTDTPIQLSARP